MSTGQPNERPEPISGPASRLRKVFNNNAQSNVRLQSLAGDGLRRYESAGDPQSLQASSLEFRTFWGKELNPAWFEKRRRISFFWLWTGGLLIVTFLLTLQLIFPPAELYQAMRNTQHSSASAPQSATEPPKQATTQDE